jgi:hypothetical protein
MLYEKLLPNRKNITIRKGLMTDLANLSICFVWLL